MLYSLLRRRYHHLWRRRYRKFFSVWSFPFLGGESFTSSLLPRRRRPFAPFSLFSFFSLLGGFNTKIPPSFGRRMQNLLLFLFFFFRVGEDTFGDGFCRRRGKEQRLNDTIIIIRFIRRYRSFHRRRLLFLLSLSFTHLLVIFFLFLPTRETCFPRLVARTLTAKN